MSKLVPYLGGKRLLAKTIVKLLPPHELYCEVFGGSATILLEKSVSKIEILNDLNGEVINLFRVVQNHIEEFIRQVRWTIISRDEFERQKALHTESLTDIQRAVRLYYLLRGGYAGKLGSPSFGAKSFPLSRVEESLIETHQRLENVIFENLPYEKCIEKFDRKEALFYIDPPYWGCEGDYGKGLFAREDFEKIRNILQKLKGQCILSLNDRPEVRAMFAGFEMVTTKLNYSAAKDKGKEANELLICNFSVPKNLG